MQKKNEGKNDKKADRCHADIEALQRSTGE